MKTLFDRRKFLKTSAAFAGTAVAGEFSCIEFANAAPIQVPTVDKLSLRVLVDQQHDQFLRRSTVNGVVTSGPGRARPDSRKCCTINGVCRCTWNRSAQEQRTILLDFGYTPGDHQQHRPPEGRSEQDPGADRQPRAYRSFRRPDRLPREISRRASGRPQAVCRRRGQFLPALQPQRDRRAIRRAARSIAVIDAQKVTVVLCERRP